MCKLIERPSKKDGFCFKLYHPLDQSIWAPKGPLGETIREHLFAILQHPVEIIYYYYYFNSLYFSCSNSTTAHLPPDFPSVFSRSWQMLDGCAGISLEVLIAFNPFHEHSKHQHWRRSRFGPCVWPSHFRCFSLSERRSPLERLGF